MKSQIGLEHINSQREGRIIHAVPGVAEAPAPEEAADKAAPRSDSSELIPVVVHVEKGALDAIMEKSAR
jgi:hypothetical protein